MTDVMSYDELNTRLRDLESAYSDQGRRAAREPIVKAFAAARRAVEREEHLDEALNAEIARNVGLEVELEREKRRNAARVDATPIMLALDALSNLVLDAEHGIRAPERDEAVRLLQVIGQQASAL